MLRVTAIDPTSPLFGRVRPGYKLMAVNGQPVQDSIDFRFRTSDERVSIRFTDTRGREFDLRLDEPAITGLGLTLDDHKIRQCGNDCIFCFVAQQPPGMRESLYVRDEDYRLSFTHGNFITLSNTSQKDLNRIVEQRLSPLYVSVHTSDDALRRRMFHNKRLASIMPRLRFLTENHIVVHSQVVLCPGINDGEHLDKTVADLAGLYPGVQSLAIVPVGLTKYRDGLPELRACTAAESANTIHYVEKLQKQFLSELGSRFVWAADEFYVSAGRAFPRRHEYEDMPQFENGVGMVREFMTNFNRRRASLKFVPMKRRLLLLTGESAYPFMSEQIMPYLKDALGFDVDLFAVRNRFWGETVTVTGLLTGQDLLREARTRVGECDVLVLPPNCLNDENLFLDNMTLDQFCYALGKPVIVGRYDLAATLRGLES